jgi:hypothetical protein
MIPLKIQNVQIGALSADKTFQSQKNLPQNAQRLFEAEVKKQMDEEQIKTKEAEKSDKSRIRDRKEDDENHQESKDQESKDQEKKSSGEKERTQKKDKYLIEKAPNGTIKHLDVKI